MNTADLEMEKVLRRAATDPAYREALKANPAQVLAEAGIEVNEAAEYVVLEPQPQQVQIVLRPLAKMESLSDESLDKTAGGEGEPPEPPGGMLVPPQE